MSTYELQIDGSSAEAGAERIVKSFDSIKAAADRMEGSVVASAKRMTAAFSQVSSIRGVSREAIDSLASLSNTLGKFAGPSKAAVENTRGFMAAIASFGSFKIPSSVGLANFLAATNRYSGPTPQAGKNLQSLLSALNGFSGVAGVGARLNGFFAALGSFRGPNANAGRNVASLFEAMKGFTGLPRGFTSSAQAFIAFAAAVDRVTASFRSLREVSSAKIPTPSAAVRVPSASVGGGKNIRGLANDFGFLETSVLRTQTALNSLGGVLAFKQIVTASNDVLKIRAQLEAATGSAQQARIQFAYLQDITQKFGLDLVSTSKSYGLFLGSIKGTGTSIADATKIFQGFATAGRALQLSTDDMDGIFRALGQIISKGKLQAEELRGQLGDRLPGAFVRMAAALHISVTELDSQMKKGLISGKKLQDGLLELASNLENEFAGSAEKASKTVDASFNRMKNAFTLAASGLGQAGLNQGLIDIVDSLTKLINSKGLAVLLGGIGKAFKLVGENVNFFASVLGGAAISYTLKNLIAQLSKLKSVGSSVGDVFRKAGVGAAVPVAAEGAPAAAAATGVAGAASGAAAATSGQAAATRDASVSLQEYIASSRGATEAAAGQGAASAAAGEATAVAAAETRIAAGSFGLLSSGSLGAAGAFGQMAATSTTAATATTTLNGLVSTSATTLQTQAGAAQFAAREMGTLGAGFATVAAETTTLSGGVGTLVSTLTAETTSLGVNTAALGTYSMGLQGTLLSTSELAVGTDIVTTALATETGAAFEAVGALGGLTVANGGLASSAAVTTGATDAATGAFAAQGVAAGITTGGVGALSIAMEVNSVATQTNVGANTADTVAKGANTIATGLLAGATSALTVTFNLLKATMLTIPFLAVAAAVASVIYYMVSMNSASEEAEKKVNSLASAEADGENLMEAYRKKVAETSGELDNQVRSLNQVIIATINLRNAQAAKIDFAAEQRLVRKGGVVDTSEASGWHYEADLGGEGGGQMVRNTRRTIAGADMNVVYLNGKPLPAALARTLSGVGSFQNGKFTLNTDYNDAASYKRATQSQAELQSFVNTAQSAAAVGSPGSVNSEQLDTLTRIMKSANSVRVGVRNKAQAGDKGLGFDPLAVDTALFGDYNKAGPPSTPGVTAPPKPGAKSKADRAAEAAAKKAAAAGRADDQDVRKAQEAVRDLTHDITASNDAITALSRSGTSAAAAAAVSAATNQVNNFEDSFATVERAQSGIVKFSGALKGTAQDTLNAVQQAQAIVDKAAAGGAVPVEQLAQAKARLADTSQEEIDAAHRLVAANTSGYVSARAAAIDYLAALQQVKAERAKELEITKSLHDANLEIARKTGGNQETQGVDLPGATLAGGDTLRQAVILQEALAEAVGTSASKHDELVASLVRTKTAQADLNTLLADAATLHQQSLAATNAAQEAPLYAQGLKPEDLEYYKKLIEYRNKLIEEGGRSNERIDYLVGQQRNALDLERTLGQLQKQYEKLNQVAQDMADAVVDGFRDATANGQSFLSSMGNIFKDLKKIILDFVIYNPLRQFLTATFAASANNVFGDKSIVASANAQANGITASNAPGNNPILANLQAVATSVAGVGTAVGALAGKASPGGSNPTQNNHTTALTGEDPNEVIVQAIRPIEAAPGSVAAGVKQPGYFSALTKLFDYHSNQSVLGAGFKQIGSAFKATGNFGSKLDALGQGLGQVAQAAGAAFAAFSVGHEVGTALGLGRTGSNVLGGAAAGFAVGGPIGAAVGAAAGLIASLFGHTKKPQARASVTVGGSGTASVGDVYSVDGGDAAGVSSAAGGASSFFQQMAATLDSTLRAGNYGTFGQSDKIKGDTKTFYSTTGNVDKYGRPTGVQGTDYIIGTPDALAAFALKTQIKAGQFNNLDPIYAQIAQNTTSTTTDGLASDFNVGKNYLAFVDQAKFQTDLEKQTKALNKSYNELRTSSLALGLSTAQLTGAYNKLVAKQREDFNFNIHQGILGITDPIMAEYNQLVKDYQNSVRDANATGGDLAAVEEYYGLQRAQIVKKYAEQANNSYKNAAQQLLLTLTGTSSSPLNDQSIFNNAQSAYTGLTDQIKAGDYSNYDKLGDYTQNYLQAAQALFSSSTDYFSIFQQVTDFLNFVSASAPKNTGITDPADLPALPTLDAIQAQIIASNGEVVAATDNVGSTLVETNDILTGISDGTTTLNSTLQAFLNTVTSDIAAKTAAPLATIAESRQLTY